MASPRISPKLHTNDFAIEYLGERTIATPLSSVQFVDGEKVLLDLSGCNTDCLAEMAGPRSKLFFDPANIKIAIVSCGGLCPGINSVVRALVMTAYHRYGVRQIVGYKYGFDGLNPALSETIELTPDVVKDLHHFGGSILGMSRGPQETNVMVDFLVKEKVDVLFTIGGDGTFKGCHALHNEVQRRGLKISVVGVPKTIDNDLLYTERSFGFDTAVEEAKHAITAAHNEARSHRNGVGIVKLMGRDSGFISLYAAIASSDVNLVLLPEVPFKLARVCDLVLDRLKRRGHVMIVVAEGAAQDLLQTTPPKFDASGNKVLADVGTWLRDEIHAYLKKQNLDHTIKYIDPSYTIRAAPANTVDSIFCVQVAQMALHTAMSGGTDCTVGLVNGQFIMLPLARTIEARKKVDIHSLIYQTMLDNTGMPIDLL